jgi:hypothetical protein
VWSRYCEGSEFTRGIFLAKAILNDEWAKPVIDYGINSVSDQFDQREARTKGGVINTYLVGVVHGHSHTWSFEVIYIHHRRGRPISRSVHKLELAWSRSDVVR